MEGCLTTGLKLAAAAWLGLWLVPSANAQDCNFNDVPEAQDIAVGTSQECNGNGLPDECEMYEEAKLTASDTESQDDFGYFLSLDGDLLVVGAYGDNDRGTGSGSIYLFRHIRAGWIAWAKPTAADGTAGDSFGAVDSRGQTLVVGGPGWLQNVGSAYAYRLQDLDWDRTPDTCDLCPATIGGVLVDINGCPPFVPGDFDRDGDVDMNDLAVFEACATAPAISQPSPDCVWACFDTDDDIDQADFAVFQRCLSGEKPAADPNCAS